MLGQDPFLVLHGGGNTSFKDDDFIWAKASGFDLGALVDEGLVQLRRPDLDSLLSRDELSDIGMMEGYAAATVLGGQPAPTIEALLHHALPFTSILHTHADAIVALTDTDQGLGLVTEVLGDEVLTVPFVMPGFELAKQASALWKETGGKPRALVLQHHGLFTMADTVEEAYELHLDIVGRAEAYIESAGVDLRAPFSDAVRELSRDESGAAAALLDALLAHSTSPVTVLVCDDNEVRSFIGREDLQRVALVGPTTLEHVIRTKRVPLLGNDVARYIREYEEYFARNKTDHGALRMLEPLPRVILHPEIGLVAVGASRQAASAVMDIYRHTIRIIDAAERLGGYRTVTEAQAFGIEYWELEQRRLKLR